MTASERLRALEVHLSGASLASDPVYARNVLRGALPLIADVVEAAEVVSRVEATGTLPDFKPLADALTALRDALEEKP